MPLYEYQCEKCGRVFEVMQKFSDAPLETHQGCGGTVKRLLSVPALQFKGSGWYITDYARGSSTPKAEKSEAKSESPSSEAKSESKADSKPAAPAKTD